MSSPSSQSENAAPPALLSREAQAATVAVPDPSPTVPAVAVAASAEKVSGQNLNLDLDLNPPPVNTQPSSSSTLPIRSRDADQGLVRDDIKSRGPNQHIQRQPGPSLLTKALASARGIPQGQNQKPNNSNNTTPNTAPSYPDTNGSSSSGSSIRSSRPEPTLHPRLSDQEHNPTNSSPYTASRSTHMKHGEQQTSLAFDPSASTSAMAAPTMIPKPSVAIPTRDPAAVPRHFNPANLVQAREVLMEHREFLDRARGRASTSLELDRSGSDVFKSRAFSLSASPEESTTPTLPSYLSNDPLQSSSTKVTNASTSGGASQLPHTTKLERNVTLSPEKTEKIWSIGSRDGDQEDGLVEKSIAEAMAGVEPNARSRKASYSLRFFKEGLPPEDKPRRKDTKTTPRDALSPTWEERAGEEWAVATPPLHRHEERQRATQSAHGGDANRASSDYFNLEPANAVPVGKPSNVLRTKSQPESHAATAKPIPPPSEVGPTPAAQADSVEGQRRPGDDDRFGEITTRSSSISPGATAQAGRDSVDDDHDDADAETEDADESGEEKISSAVFLPHQEMPDARSTAPEVTSSIQTQRPRSISHSSSHPWLVKADEPEPEPEPELEQEPHDEEETAPPAVAHSETQENGASPDLELQEKPEEVVIAVEPILKSSHTAPKAQPAVTQYEDHVHHHQHHPRQPLEAIELIPYKHQVGGHTTLWRFSRRAVCKQLNNRENEFYETIERYHRDLLPFLPR